MVLYISEHPENKQGGVRVYSSLSGLFHSSQQGVILPYVSEIFPREKGLLRKSMKKVLCLKEMMLQKEFKHDKHHPYP